MAAVSRPSWTTRLVRPFSTPSTGCCLQSQRHCHYIIRMHPTHFVCLCQPDATNLPSGFWRSFAQSSSLTLLCANLHGNFRHRLAELVYQIPQVEPASASVIAAIPKQYCATLAAKHTLRTCLRCVHSIAQSCLTYMQTDGKLALSAKLHDLLPDRIGVTHGMV